MISPQGAAMINVGIIGSGFIGPAHIEALRRLGFVQVVALCDGSLVKAQEKAHHQCAARLCQRGGTARAP